ncbi:PREDICTED: tripartite motif-containing protein 3-like [Branchiostoma belcheri]|uniref:Tripartite motif-containing protein 3-like n=1 Tax=Branchiostoma belcheri TaxID=7741 RepID=A0A6P4ZQD7_BRABE|nr:PREDICTED: tripartite motif-containing protein 3-like [Branchiostoma belcheri]
MAKNLPSNTAPKAMVVRNEFFSESMAKPDTGIAPSTFTQAADGASHHISGECCDVKQKKIKFGGRGKEPGKFINNVGVAVSADNEMFVTDWNNQRVQVFSMNGTYLRLFRTVVPGKSKKMYPYDVASDIGPGYLWVLGRSSRFNKGHVVKYSKNGQPIQKFDVSLKSVYPAIAMDVRNNNVIVGDKKTVMMFDPNGSRLWSSEVRTVNGISGVTSDKEGNVLLTDGSKAIQKHNSSGVKIFEFGTYGKGKGQLNRPTGICLDTSGRIIVANSNNNRVDMFTSQGQFVRTIAIITYPRGIAMGPCGELVVTSPLTYTVTIFPRANGASLKP